MTNDNDFAALVGTQRVERSLRGEPADANGPVPQSVSDTKQVPVFGAKRWSANGDAYHGASDTHDRIPAGLYRCSMSPSVGPVLIKQTVKTDNLLSLPDDAVSSVLDEFELFWKVESKFRERGFVFKRGYLLWGPPGSGKTSSLQLMIKRLIDSYDGVVLFIDSPHEAAFCLQLLRSIEAERPVICVMEDIDALVHRYGENEYLALLDGEAQVDRICFVATTNYPERLDKRFVDRPSRFDTIKYIGMPSAAARRVYLQNREPSLTDDELDLWVDASDGFSVAHLKEMIVAVKCLGQNLNHVVERLESLRSEKPDSTRSPERPAFGLLGAAINGRSKADAAYARSLR